MHIYRSPKPALVIPQMTITDLVLAGLGPDPHRVVIRDGATGHCINAADFRDRIQRLAGGLTVRGHGAGHVTAIMAPNSPDYAVAFHAPLYAGGTSTTVNPSYTANELRHQLTDSRATLLITAPSFLAVAREAADGTGVRQIALIGGASDGLPGIDDLMGAPLAAQVPVDLAVHVAALPYSSGTTGLSKGVMLTHRNLVANVVQCTDMLDLTEADRTLGILPYFHIYGLQVIMNAYLASGATQTTLPRFDLEAVLRILSEERIGRFYVAPPVVLAFAKHPMVDQFDLSALHTIFSAAAPLGAELSNACATRLGCEVVQGYGMTELSPVTHGTFRGNGRPGSVGQLVALTEGRIVDIETGADLDVGKVGEVLVAGPQVMAGYLNNEKATSATVDADGWLHTGDLGYMDADGYLFIVDRVKELIKYKGFQVAPAELEALLVTHPGIADAAVVGRPDDEAGEVPVAHVVRRGESAVTEAEVIAFVAAKVATYKRLAAVRFTDTIPKSPSGKILRRLLKAAS
jgi:acyl-CoA synthetase (AMP-forming)/AMP-acid ligase II